MPDSNSKTGYRPVFDLKAGEFGLPMALPCRQCVGCRIDYAKGWATRILQEAQFHPYNYFLTQTYDDEHLPAGGSLVKRDLQKFTHAVRRHFPRGSIRFYGVGEYGDQTARPHYHQILFCDQPIPDLKPHSKGKSGEQLFVSEMLNSSWGKGLVLIGSVTEKSAEYVGRYAVKKINGDRAAMHYERIDPTTGERYWLQPEFSLMSRRPGIGRKFYETFGSDLYPSDFVVVKGQKRAVPAYYDGLLDKDNPELFKQIKRKRKVRAKRRAHDNTPERLKVREEVARARLSLKKRKI